MSSRNAQVSQMAGALRTDERANAYAEVATVVRRYQRAAAGRDMPVLDELMSPIWNGKRATGADGAFAVNTKEIALGVAGGSRQDGDLTSVQMYFDDFAVARTDDWKNPATTIYTLFKTAGAWRIAGEASTSAAVGTRQARYTPSTAEGEVLRVLGGYYRAVVDGDADVLDTVFHPDWHMKNHEAGDLVSEDRATFKARIRNTPLKAYANDRQIADVQIAWDRLACVRVDKPSSSGVTVFLFFRVGAKWQIVDKAWSVAKA